MVGTPFRRIVGLIWVTITTLWIATTPLGAQDNTMETTRPELIYAMTITAENASVKVFVNGAPLVLHSRFSPMQFTTGITDFLRPGANAISLQYEPINVEAKNFTPHNGVALQVKLTRRSNQLADGTPIEETVHLFSGRYATETGQMMMAENSVFNQGPVVRQDGGLVAGAGVSLAPTTIVFGNRTSDIHAMELTLPFDVNDTPMPTPAWDASPAMADTPALRAEIWQAYQALHDAMTSGNAAQFRQIMDPVYSHLALTLGYDDATALADAIAARRPFTGGDGERVAPLPPAMAASTGNLDFGIGNQMVRLSPSPLAYETLEGQPAGTFNVYFCRRPGGALAVCHVQDIPY